MFAAQTSPRLARSKRRPKHRPSPRSGSSLNGLSWASRARASARLSAPQAPKSNASSFLDAFAPWLFLGGGDPLVPEEVYAGGRAVQIPEWHEWAIKVKAELDRLREEAA